MMTPLPFVVLLLSIAPTLAEVVHLMSQCDGFLLNNKAPQVPDILVKGEIHHKKTYKVICQTYNNVTRFMTLYDTKNKIPVLSAFRFTGAQGGRPEREIWKIEPQLEDPNSQEKNMVDCNINTVYNKQASDLDYVNNVNMTKVNRGHLFPSSYANTPDDKVATFTLTNAVPQRIKFNSGTWAKMESCVKCVMEKFCLDNNDQINGYVITGAKPGSVFSSPNRVNVPSMLWSAFCCYNGTQDRWIASAYWGENRDKGSDGYLHTRTLQELYTKLSSGNQEFNAFPKSSCPREKTVAEFYPKMHHDCHCQPAAPVAPVRPVGPGLE